MRADNNNTRVSTIKDTHLQNEGNIPMNTNKCKTCTEYNCKNCLKNDKINSAEETMLQEMHESIKKIPLPDGTTQFSVKYVTNSPLSQSFPSNTSN